MPSLALLSLPLLGSVAAAESVTSLFLPGFDAQTLLGSVMGTSGSTTTLFVHCPAGTPADDCGVAPGLTAIAAPKTADITFQDKEAKVSLHLQCDLSNPDVANCVETIGGASAIYPGTSTGSFTGAEIASMYLPVTITTGAASTGASATTSTASMTSAPASAGATTAVASATTLSVTTLTGTHSASTASAASSNAASSASTGGVPRVTGGAQWAAGGAAVALALAAL